MAYSYTCKIRIYVTCDDTGAILTNSDQDDSLHGHYDLQITCPSEAARKAVGLAYQNTVFSYLKGEDGGGQLWVFKADKTGTIFKNKKPYRLYYWSFTVKQNQVSELKSKLASCIAKTKHTEADYTWYKVVNKTFKKYNIATANCFRMTAILTNWLGNDTLLKIYNQYSTKEAYKKYDGHPYRQYFAWHMRQKYRNKWTGGTLFNT